MTFSGFDPLPLADEPPAPTERPTRTPFTTRERWLLAIALVAVVTSIALAIALVIVVSSGSQTGTGPASSPSAPATAAPERTASPTPTPTAGEPAPPTPAQLLAALEAIPVTTAPASGYHREAFGQTWLDVDRNGCDTRNDILGRDLMDVVFKAGTNDCKVLSGVLIDPFTGAAISFVSGPNSNDVQIDHIVPLAWAWRNGASVWDQAVREAFANDPSNLIAVSGPLNQEKSDGGPARWLPPNRDYVCDYIGNFVSVLVSYGLTIPSDDKQVARAVLERC